MRTIINMARLHLQLLAQDRSTLVQGFVVPVILMVVLAAAVGDNVANDVTLLVDVDNRDQTELSDDFITTLRATSDEVDAVLFCVYGADDNPDECEQSGLNNNDTFDDVGTERLEDLTTSAALIIPEGFGQSIADGETVALEYRNDDDFGNRTVAQSTVETALTRFNASLAIAQLGLDAVEEYFGGFDSPTAREADYNTLLQRARAELETAPANVTTRSADEEIVIGLGARQAVPGQGSMFVLFTLIGIATFMVEERNQGTLQRLFIIPTNKFNIVFGKILGVFLFGVMQFAIFIGVGALLGIDWGGDYLAIGALIVSFCLAGTALGFLVSTFTRTTAQAANAATFFGLVLAPLGGAWWPLTIVPDFMQTIGHISPIAWLMDGFYEVLYYNGGIVEVLPMTGALLLFAAVFTAAGVMRFSYE
jgi:ABC-2 type transport system permease protein